MRTKPAPVTGRSPALVARAWRRGSTSSPAGLEGRRGEDLAARCHRPEDGRLADEDQGPIGMAAGVARIVLDLIRTITKTPSTPTAAPT